jgi:hypothetical protein
MATTYDQFMANLGKGEIKESGGGSSYELKEGVLSSAKFIRHSELPPVLQTAFTDKDSVYWEFVLEFDGLKKELYSSVLTKAGDIACYPTSKDGAFAGHILHDIVTAIKAVDANALPEGWFKQLPAILVGKKIKMQIKVLPNAMDFIPLTSRQAKKDAEWAASQETKKDVVIDSDDVPF